MGAGAIRAARGLYADIGAIPFDVRCGWLTSFHERTHSNDSITNNAHELHDQVRYTDGTRLHSVPMSRLAPVGRFVRAWDTRTVVDPRLAPRPGQLADAGPGAIPTAAARGSARESGINHGQWRGVADAVFRGRSTGDRSNESSAAVAARAAGRRRRVPIWRIGGARTELRRRAVDALACMMGQHIHHGLA